MITLKEIKNKHPKLPGAYILEDYSYGEGYVYQFYINFHSEARLEARCSDLSKFEESGIGTYLVYEFGDNYLGREAFLKWVDAGSTNKWKIYRIDQSDK